MKNILFFFILMTVSAVGLSAQGISIGSGTTVSLGGSTLLLSNNWTNEGTFDGGTGTVIFNGPNGNQTITNDSGEIFLNLIVNKISGEVVLNNNITVNGNLTITSGDLNMNGRMVTMGSSALLSETASNTVKGKGYITGTTTLNAPSAANPFGLGAIITSSADLGSTVIRRGHTVQYVASDSSILRYYNITPSNNSGLDATLVFHYDNSELNGLLDSTLYLYRCLNPRLNFWVEMGGMVNISARTVTLDSIDGFSAWTLVSKDALTDVKEPGTGESNTGVPRVFSLAQNFPNPFNPTTTISFTLAKDGLVTLKVYDLLGREVAMLVNEELRAGVLHHVTFDASRLSTGIYIYRLQSRHTTGGQAGNTVLVKKLILVK